MDIHDKIIWLAEHLEDEEYTLEDLLDELVAYDGEDAINKMYNDLYLNKD